MTEARVGAVMLKVAANLRAFVVAGYLDTSRAMKWAVDLTYLQLQECLEFFEIQINGRSLGLRYRVSSDGSVQQDSAAGGLDVYGLPATSTVQLYAHLRNGTPQYVREELARRGWGFNGLQIDAPESEHRTFPSNGYGLTRSKLGIWP